MCRIPQKEIIQEKLRHHYLLKIVERFAEEIDKKGGFLGNSKTAKFCRRDGTKKGISALMERWFLIQELLGVLILLFANGLGKYRSYYSKRT